MLFHCSVSLILSYLSIIPFPNGFINIKATIFRYSSRRFSGVEYLCVNRLLNSSLDILQSALNFLTLDSTVLEEADRLPPRLVRSLSGRPVALDERR